MFSGSAVFDTFIALSPSIFWNDNYLVSEAKQFLSDRRYGERLTLYLSYGYYEQYIRRRKAWSEAEYALRAAHALGWRTNDLIEEMAARLRASDKVKVVKCKAYADEDHGSVAGCAIGWAMLDVLDPDRFA
jgi:hypothetical protein